MTTEGSIEFWLKPKSPANWHSDSHSYRFPVEQKGGIEIAPVKNSDRTVTMSVKGIATNPIELSAPIQRRPSDMGLFVVITWSPTQITLLLDGIPAKQLEISF